ncbi:MAG TPA: YdcF family protein [Candidatus Limnocylindria bacterium]|nr:YdcF family protein [Candidatus Limnocylindria bacterium]
MTSRAVLRSVMLLAGWGLGGGILLLGYMAIRISAQGDRDERRPADAIVVLGAAQFNGTPGGVFEARLRHAVDLYHEGVAPYLVVTGGKLLGDRTTEAATARAWAIENGVPEGAILAEDKGRNTLSSLEAVSLVMREHDLASAVFVSDRTHMLRVLRMASDQGIVAWGSPTQSSPTDRDEWRRRKAMVHELAGLVAYYVGAGRLIGDAANAKAP